MRFERVARMIEEINKGRYPNVEHFCREFEIAPRTALADIRYLKEDMQQEIKYDKFHGGYHNLNPTKELPQFNLTDGEVFALTLGKEMLSQYTGTSFEPLLRGAIEKICDRLPEKVKVDVDDIKCMVKFHSKAVIPISRKMFLDLNRACEKTLPVDIIYFGARTGDTTERTIYPYRIVENRATWYVVGHCTLRNALRMFALHRIQEWKLRNERFRVPEDLDIDNWLESAFQLEHGDQEQTVRVHFQPLSARYIRERRWHLSQRLEEHHDGACTLEFKTQNLEEVKRWVLTYGSDAEVLAPPALRDLIADELKLAAARYRNTPTA
jgi:predicted DNA-binding transcriptional regulator YafY